MFTIFKVIHVLDEGKRKVQDEKNDSVDNWEIEEGDLDKNILYMDYSNDEPLTTVSMDENDEN